MADGKSIKVTVDIVAGSTKGSKEVIDEVKRINRETTQNAKQQAKFREDAHKQMVRNMENDTRQWERREKQAARDSANAFIKSLKDIEHQSKKTRGVFGEVFSGAFFGNLGGMAVGKLMSAFSVLPGFIRDVFEKSMNFSQMSISLAQFEGSVDKSQAKIRELMKVAAETPGLSFLSAVEGQKRLEAIGFESDKATKILQGMAKIRILSGSSKEDFNAMLVNLVQIASGGQKVTQEIREMATRMPYLVGIIKKEFGTIGKELNDIDPKVFIERMVNAAAKTDAAFASSALAVENFQDSIDRLYIAIGSIIEQNPRVIALFELWTGEIDRNSMALADNESQQRKTFSSFIDWLAKSAISAQNFGSLTAAVIADVVNGLGSVGTRVGLTLALAIGKVRATVDYMGALVGEKVNTIIDGINNITSAVGLSPIAKFELSPTAVQDAEANFNAVNQNFVRMWEAQEKYYNTQKGWFTRSKQALIDNADRWTEFNFLTKRAEGEIKKNRSTQYKANNDISSVGRKEDGGGRKSKLSEAGVDEFVTNRIKAEYEKALRNLSPALKLKIESAANQFKIPSSLAFAQIFSESRFNPKADSGQASGLTQFTKGTASRFGYSIQELVNNPDKALSAWGKYMTQLFERYGDWELATLAYHQGEGTVDKLVKVLGSGNKKAVAGFLKARPKGTSYIKQISALAGLRGDDQFQPADPSKISDAVTKAEQEKNIRAALDLYKRFGLIPSGEVLNKFRALMVEDAKKAGAVQPSEADVAKIFADNFRSAGSDFPTPTVSGIAERRQTLDEQYLSNLRESLGIEERKDELIFRRRNFEKEISEYYLLGQITQGLEILDITREISILNRQNADDQFTEQRRLLSAKREEYQLQQEITQLQDELYNGSVNNSLKIQVAYLQDIIDLRNRELDAVISINRSQLELSQSMEVSNNQIRARVLEHLASQKTLNESIADGIINIYESAATGIEKLLDKSGIGKIPIIGDLAKNSARNTLTNITRGLLDKFLPPEISEQLNKTGNPLLDENIKQSKHLESIDKKLGGSLGLSTRPRIAGSSIFDLIGGINGGSLSGLGGSAGQPRGVLGDLLGTFGGANSGGQGGFSLKNILGKGGIFGDKGFGNNVGTFGTLGMGAGLLGNLVGGRFGGVLSGAGQGLALGAQIGSIIPGIGTAIGAGIGAAAGALFGLFSGGDKSAKYLKSASQSEFGINVKDKSILKQLRAYGESAYGKVSSLPVAIQTVNLPPSMDLLRAYAESTGQSTKKFDLKALGEENNPLNQFRGKFAGYREFGGDVRAGYSYIVGERRPELFTPTVNGYVSPQVPNTKTNDALTNRLIAMVGALMETVDILTAKITSMSPGAIVAIGTTPEVVGKNYESYVGGGGRRAENLRRGTGNVLPD